MRTAIFLSCVGSLVCGSTLEAGDKPTMRSTFNSKNWTIEVEVVLCPGAGFGGAAVLDEKGQDLLIWGGMAPSGEPSGKLFRFSLDSRKMTPIPIEGPIPSALFFPGLALDAKRKGIYLFGGWGKGAENPSDQLFKLTLADKTPTWKGVEKAGPWPGPRNGTCFVVDKEGDGLILFGGDGGPGEESFTPLNDLWRFDLVKGQWERLKPRGDFPPPRWHAMAAIDRKTRQMYLLGGAGLGRDAFDPRLYELDLKANQWRAVETKGEVPPSLQGATLTLDEGQKAFLLVGGLRNEGEGPATSPDMWVFDVKTGTWEKLDRGKEVQRRDHVGVYDPTSGLHVLVGGRVSNEVGNFYERGEPVQSAVALKLKRRTKE